MPQRKIESHLPPVTRIWVESPYRVRFLSYNTDPWNNVYPDNGLLVVAVSSTSGASDRTLGQACVLTLESDQVRPCG
jgi:hypothetical protein